MPILPLIGAIFHFSARIGLVRTQTNYILHVYLMHTILNRLNLSIAFLSTFADKFLFCYFYRIPPKYSDAIGSRSTTLIGFSIPIHIFMILRNNQIFSGESIVNNVRIDIVRQLKLKDIRLKKHIVTLEIIAVIFFMNVLIKKILICSIPSFFTVVLIPCIEQKIGV